MKILKIIEYFLQTGHTERPSRPEPAPPLVVGESFPIPNGGYLKANTAVRCGHDGCQKWAQWSIGQNAPRNAMTGKPGHLCCASRHCYPR